MAGIPDAGDELYPKISCHVSAVMAEDGPVSGLSVSHWRICVLYPGFPAQGMGV